MTNIYGSRSTNVPRAVSAMSPHSRIRPWSAMKIKVPRPSAAEISNRVAVIHPNVAPSMIAANFDPGRSKSSIEKRRYSTASGPISTEGGVAAP